MGCKKLKWLVLSQNLELKAHSSVKTAKDVVPVVKYVFSTNILREVSLATTEVCSITSYIPHLNLTITLFLRPFLDYIALSFIGDTVRIDTMRSSQDVSPSCFVGCFQYLVIDTPFDIRIG
jgi:hypothetical protein